MNRQPRAQAKAVAADRSGEVFQLAFFAMALVLEFTTMLVG